MDLPAVGEGEVLQHDCRGVVIGSL
jgi:hypothetical protein